MRKTDLITLKEAEKMSVTMLKVALGEKVKYLIEDKGFDEDEAKNFVASIISLDRALVKKDTEIFDIN